MTRTVLYTLALLLLAGVSSFQAKAGEARAAVAANFAVPAQEIAKAFHKESSHTILFSVGSTGQLYAQISQGAPFDMFLAADALHPEKAIAEGLAVEGSLFTYALGTLVLYSKQNDLILDANSLQTLSLHKLAIPNPTTAPYGSAAVEVLKAIGAYPRVKDKLVLGNSVAQAYQFIDTENADIGFIALSQVIGHNRGSHWIIPQTLHSAITQKAVLLKHGANNPAALAFLTFLKNSKASGIKQKYGYGSIVE